MQSLILPLVLLALLGLWWTFESGRKFRKEFEKRGREWTAVCAAIEAGQGILAVDTIWGPQRGLGHPTIWWISDAVAPGEDLAARIETGGSAQLVKCPKRLKRLDALRAKFGPQRVVAHTWAVGGPLTGMPNQ